MKRGYLTTLLVPAFFLAVCLASINRSEANTLPREGTMNYYELYNCWDFTIQDPRAYPHKRTYTIEGKCQLFYKTGAAANANFRIYAEYDRVGKVARESGHLWFDKVYQSGDTWHVGSKKFTLRTYQQTDVRYKCSDDPWLRGGACSIIIPNYSGPPASIGYNVLTSGPEQEQLLIFHNKSDQPLPLSRGAGSALHAYLNQTYINPARAPRIVSPKYNAAYKVGELIVDVDKAPPDLGNWQLNYTYPPEASTVLLTWEHWDPRAAKWVGTPLLESLQNIDTLPNTVIPTTWSHEGKWRVRARHNVPNWQPGGWTEFWIGDRFNLSETTSFNILSPSPNEEHLNTDSQGLFPVDFLVQHSLDQPIEVQYDRFGEISSGHHGWVSNYSTQTHCCRRVNEPWTLHLERGWWGFRVRWKKNDDEMLYRPWSEWRRFWAGTEYDAYQVFKMVPPQQLEQFSHQSLSGLAPGSPGRASATAIVPPSLDATDDQSAGRDDIARRPDLVIERYWVEADRESKMIYFNWLVRNIGGGHSAQSTLTVTCRQLGAVSCPWGEGPYSRRVRSLAPAREGLEPENDFAAGEVISLGMDAPSAPAKFKLVAQVDSIDAVKEIDERNNHNVSEYETPGTVANIAQIGRGHSSQIANVQSPGKRAEAFPDAMTQPSGILLLSPQRRQVFEGDVIVQIQRPKQLKVADLYISFQNLVGNRWQQKRIRGSEKLRSTNNKLFIPRDRFGQGGRWRLCVHEATQTCSENHWAMFGFAGTTGARQTSPTISKDLLKAVDPSRVVQP